MKINDYDSYVICSDGTATCRGCLKTNKISDFGNFDDFQHYYGCQYATNKEEQHED